MLEYSVEIVEIDSLLDSLPEQLLSMLGPGPVQVPTKSLSTRARPQLGSIITTPTIFRIRVISRDLLFLFPH